MIKGEGGTAVAEACDATKEADCKRLVDAAVDRWGRLDFLDNNVGIGSRGSVVDEKPDEYRRVMQVNVETMFLVSKHAIPAMIKTAKGGAIVKLAPKDGGTLLAYEVDAQIGGKLAQLGQRLVNGASKKLADEFFQKFAANVASQS